MAFVGKKTELFSLFTCLIEKDIVFKETKSATMNIFWFFLFTF